MPSKHYRTFLGEYSGVPGRIVREATGATERVKARCEHRPLQMLAWGEGEGEGDM